MSVALDGAALLLRLQQSGIQFTKVLENFFVVVVLQFLKIGNTFSIDIWNYETHFPFTVPFIANAQNE